MGAKGQSNAAAQAMLTGGANAAGTMAQSNAFNPLSAALIGGASNPQLMNAINSFGFGGGSDSYFGKSGGLGFDISKLFGT